MEDRLKQIIDSSITLSKQGFKVDILTADSRNSNFLKSKNIRIINKGPRIGNYDLNFKLFFWFIQTTEMTMIYLLFTVFGNLIH